MPEMPEHYSAGMRKLLERMLCKNPDERPSAAELVRDPLLRPYVPNVVDQMCADGADKGPTRPPTRVLQPPPSPLPPQRNYRVIKVLGAGSYGEVMLVDHVVEKRKVSHAST